MSERQGTSVDSPTIRLGVSSCLMGEEVRFDGGHKRDTFLINVLSRYVEWVRVCPEVGIGLGIPRETIRLVGEASSPRLLGVKSERDHTDAMVRWSAEEVERLAGLKLHGYVLKKDSPSCGLFRVRVYDVKTGTPARTGRGVFANEIVKRMPLLPVEEEGRLNDLPLRENFIERVFAYRRWTDLLDRDPTPSGLVAFHTAHKLTMLSHSPKHYREMGRLVAEAGLRSWDDISSEYGRLLMEGLQVLGTPGKHTNVMHHLMGFIKNDLSKDDKAEMLDVIESYRQRLVPPVVPLTLLNHHLRRYRVPDWVHEQVYLNPYPAELMLRNHV